jgi:hypothetical protein
MRVLRVGVVLSQRSAPGWEAALLNQRLSFRSSGVLRALLVEQAA